MESLQERIRWQFEQCDSISGVVLLEDLSRGWDMIQTVTEYISEEDVRTVLRQLTLSVSYLLTREEESAHA